MVLTTAPDCKVLALLSTASNCRDFFYKYADTDMLYTFVQTTIV